jgi:porin
MSDIRREASMMQHVRAAAIMLSFLIGAGTASAEEKSLSEREKLTGDWGGGRTTLEEKGIEVGLQYIGEVLGISGGLKPGGPLATYEGRFDLTVDTDLEKLMGWTGGKTHARVFQINNAQNMNAADHVGSIADPSNIDAYGTTRLFTAWFQQDFGKLASVRMGQLAADDEFLVSITAGGLINGTFGWATIMSANLPSGGPAYPLATPGMRVQVNPTETVSLLGAVFSGDPAGKDCYRFNPDADPQVCNRYGITFSFSGGAFWLGEAQYNVNQDKESKGLAGSYKIGAWYHSGSSFPDQRFGLDELGIVVPLALDPPLPLNQQGNWGVYGVLDQMIWRGTESSASLFVRAGWAPADRNLLSWYIDAGIGLKGFVPRRVDDTLTIGVAHSKISPYAIAADRDQLFFNSLNWPLRSGETVFEVSYIAQITPWWTVQPDFQYIVKPGGNVPRDEEDLSLGVVPNAYVLGVRTTVTF